MMASREAARALLHRLSLRSLAKQRSRDRLSGGPAVAFDLSDYFQKHGQRLVAAALHRAVGKPTVYVLQEDHYRQTVVQPGWESLPAPIRLMLRRRHDEWNQLFLELRDLVYDLDDGSVKLHHDAPARMSRALHRYYA